MYLVVFSELDGARSYVTHKIDGAVIDALQDASMQVQYGRVVITTRDQLIIQELPLTMTLQCYVQHFLQTGTN